MNGKSNYPLWWALSVALLGFITALRPISGMDAHWHLKLGEAYLEHGLWLQADPISYLEFVREVDMGAWGGEVLFAWAHGAFGWTGIIVLVGLVAATCHFLVFDLAWRRSKDLAPTLLVAAIFAAGAAHRWRGRPDVFSILFFILMMIMLSRKPGPKDGPKYGGLALLWINMHPGAIIMPLFALVAAFAGHRKLRLKQAGSSFLAILITPNGPIALARLVYHTVTTGKLVPEWRPLWQQPWDGFEAQWFLLAVVFAVFLLGRPWQKKYGTAVLAFLWALRSFRLSYMLFAPALASGEATLTENRRRVYFALALALVAVLPLNNRWQAFQRSRDLGASPWTGLYEPAYPIGAADFLKTQELRGNLFHRVAWGGYLGSRLAPGNRSAHDGRISEWGFDTASELSDFHSPAQREKLREKLGFEIVVVSPGLINGAELVQLGGRWRVIYADHQAAVYIDTLGANWSFNQDRLIP